MQAALLGHSVKHLVFFLVLVYSVKNRAIVRKKNVITSMGVGPPNTVTCCYYFIFSINNNGLSLYRTLSCQLNQDFFCKCLYLHAYIYTHIHINTCKHLCLECAEGYYDLNCYTPCRYPNYGKNCQHFCNCSISKCNHIKGCQGIYQQVLEL